MSEINGAAKEIVSDYRTEFRDPNLEELRRIVSAFDPDQSKIAIDIMVNKYPDVVCNAISKQMLRLQTYRDTVLDLSKQEL